MPKTNYAKYMMLGLLSYCPMTGYDIKKWADDFLKYLLVDISYGQIYPMLGQFERDGLAVVVPGAAGKRAGSKTYRLTEKGMGELCAWLRGPDTGEYDVLLKICFGSLIPEDEMIAKLDAYRKKREAELAMMDQYAACASDAAAYGPNAPYLAMITTLGMSYFRDEIAWCREAIATLEAGKKPDTE